MAYSENAFTKVSRNTPVRDELVLSLGDIFPNLKSAQGISVVKHTKRGQSEERRLRLDTDLSTLEVFRTSSGYINRKMLTRAYNLSHLDEVRLVDVHPHRTTAKQKHKSNSLTSTASTFCFHRLNLMKHCCSVKTVSPY